MTLARFLTCCYHGAKFLRPFYQKVIFFQEYKRNEVWMDLQSPRANRFIVHSDRNNPTISSLEGFEAPLAEYKPDLLVVSGLQMMDNYPFAEGEREARLKKVFFF